MTKFSNVMQTLFGRIATVTCSITLVWSTQAWAENTIETTSWSEFSYQPYPLAQISPDADRYPEATPSSAFVNQHGEIEHLSGAAFGTHWFVESNGPVWHFVTSGQLENDVVLMIHGWPDTWWANAEVMSLLSDDYYVIAVDVLGYGQSDKGPEIDVSYSATADSLVALLDNIGVDEFNLISHDRGTILSEHLLAIEGMSDRVTAFVRMQQSFDQPHGLPRPPHAQMAVPEFHMQDGLARSVYTSDYGSVVFPERFLKRLDWEFGFEGTADASARSFQGTSFDIELAFRMKHVVERMTMPVLLIQGDRDPGQKAEEYYRSAELLPDARVAIVNTNHFIHAEDPHLVADLARELFMNGNTNRSQTVFSHPVSFQFPIKE